MGVLFFDSGVRRGVASAGAATSSSLCCFMPRPLRADGAAATVGVPSAELADLATLLLEAIIAGLFAGVVLGVAVASTETS